MDLVVPPELEELILCSCCHLPFNETDASPKLFSCRHHFCLKCVNSILLKGNELYCVHCWKRTELPGPDMKPENLPTYNAILYLSQNLSMLNFKSKPPDKQQQQQSSSSTSSSSSGNGGNQQQISITSQQSSSTMKSQNPFMNNCMVKKVGENCMTHAMPNALWCTKCTMMICRACAGSEDHRNHSVKTQNEARDTLHSDITNELLIMQKTLNDVQHLVLKQRDFLLKILESCTALKTQIETELINHIPTLEIAEMRESLGKAKLCLDMLDQQTPAEAYKLYSTLNIEKQRLQSKYQEMYLQCKLDDLIKHYGVLFDFDLIKQALATLHTSGDTYSTMNGIGHHNPILLLANYCISQLYSRHILSTKHSQINNNGAGSSGGNGGGSGGGGLAYHMSQAIMAQSQQSSSQQQQQSSHVSQIMSNHPSPHDNSVKTYADVTTSSPKSNHQGNSFGSHLSDSLVVGGGSNSNGVGTIGPPGLRAGNHSQQNSVSYLPSDLNGMGVPTLAMIQHHLQQQQQQQQQQHSNQIQKSQLAVGSGQSNTSPSTIASLVCSPNVHVYPIYYFNIEMNSSPCGRILIEVRNDVAPKMAKNFGALATGELGFGYKGCQIFQCWENESIITGDFELNNGRGGRSVFEEGFFMPDDTKILAIRGSVGMRRSQKRHDNLGLVGSQFRIILREMRGFTGIFAFVIEGLELVEKISQAGDSAGKPQSNVVIVSCGKLQ